MHWLFNPGKIALSHEDYFPFSVSAVLCADRVGQMTKTYSDIDAVTRLLEEVRSNKVTVVKTIRELCQLLCIVQ